MCIIVDTNWHAFLPDGPKIGEQVLQIFLPLSHFLGVNGGTVPERYQRDLAVSLLLFCLLMVRVCQWNCHLVLHSHLIQFKM